MRTFCGACCIGATILLGAAADDIAPALSLGGFWRRSSQVRIHVGSEMSEVGDEYAEPVGELGCEADAVIELLRLADLPWNKEPNVCS